MESAQHDPTSHLDHLILRGGYFGAGLVALGISTQLWESGFMGTDPLTLVFAWVLCLLSFGLFGLAALATPRTSRYRAAIPIILVLTFFACAREHVLLEQKWGFAWTTDLRMFMDWAARLIRHGKNPYEHDLVGGFAINSGTLYFNTPLEDGDFTSRLAYPSLSALIFVPFQWAHLSCDWVYPTFFLILMLVLYRSVPSRWQPLVLIPLFLDRYIAYTLGGVSDIVWALFLVLMVVAWDRPRTRAVWFGLAAAFKQQPWLLAPFLLICIWKETEGGWVARRRALVTFATYSAATFLAVNLPWLLWSPRAWAKGVFEPLIAPLIVYSQGLATISMHGLVDIPRPVYSVIMWGIYFALLVAYAKRFSQLKPIAWLVPGAAFWFGWRGLTSYWYYWLIPLMVALLRGWTVVKEPIGEARAPVRPLRLRPIAIGAFCVLVPAAAAYAFTQSSSALEAYIRLPFYGTEFHVFRMWVSVTNQTRHPMEPKFAVQTAGGQPFYWAIDVGPPSLAPGATASYLVRAAVLSSAFETKKGGHLIIHDAKHPNERKMLPIDWTWTMGHPGDVINGRFRVWSPDGTHPEFVDIPVGWQIGHEPRNDADSIFPIRDDKNQVAVRLKIAAHEHAPADAKALFWLRTLSMEWGTPLEVKIRLPEAANRFPSPKHLYGLRLRGRPQPEIFVLFGDASGTGTLEGTPYVMLEAPRGRWSTHQLNIKKLFEQVQIHLFPHRYVDPSMPDFDVPYIPLEIELFIASSTPDRAVEGEFGRLRWLAPAPSTDERYAELSDHPEVLLTWRGDYNAEQKNLERARQLYVEALRFNPDFGPAHHQLAEVLLARRELSQAIFHYERAIALSYGKGTAYKGLAWAYFHQDNFARALELFDVSLSHAPTHPTFVEKMWLADALKGKGMTLLRLGRCDETTAAFREARTVWVAVDLPPLPQGCPTL